MTTISRISVWSLAILSAAALPATATRDCSLCGDHGVVHDDHQHVLLFVSSNEVYAKCTDLAVMLIDKPIDSDSCRSFQKQFSSSCCTEAPSRRRNLNIFTQSTWNTKPVPTPVVANPGSSWSAPAWNFFGAAPSPPTSGSTTTSSDWASVFFGAGKAQSSAPAPAPAPGPSKTGWWENTEPNSEVPPPPPPPPLAPPSPWGNIFTVAPPSPWGNVVYTAPQKPQTTQFASTNTQPVAVKPTTGWWDRQPPAPSTGSAPPPPPPPPRGSSAPPPPPPPASNPQVATQTTPVEAWGNNNGDKVKPGTTYPDDGYCGICTDPSNPSLGIVINSFDFGAFHFVGACRDLNNAFRNGGVQTTHQMCGVTLARFRMDCGCGGFENNSANFFGEAPQSATTDTWCIKDHNC